MQHVTVADLMNRSVVSTTADTRLSEVVHQMHINKVSCMLVVEENRPVGIVTERDLVRMLGQLIDKRCSRTSLVQDFMTSSPTVVQQSTPIFDALVVTQSRSIRHLPIVDDKGFLCGILSYSDLARAYERIIEQQRKIIEKEMGFETQRLREVNDQLQSLSLEDALLGIGNRRSMEVDLSYTHSSAIRYKRPYSLILYDVDYFKQYNDHYGRRAGDDALKIITEHIRCEIRKADRLYRYGGEEILLLLPETELIGATITAKRIVHNLAERNIPHAQGPFGVLTMSGGVASPEDVEQDKDWRAVVELADKRLSQAKMNGRNQVGEAAA
ncbi:MAG: GGDEF domain-containing protein [Gammaproteobacteria bacterium]|nr:GGDEF domain-containing protein [Gammaproteobacteria bacterium]